MKPRLRVVMYVLSVVLIVLGAWLLWSVSTRGQIAHGPMLQMLAPDSFTVVWDARGDEAVLLEVREKDGEWSEQIEVKPEDGRCEVTIDGLQPNTRYLYDIRAMQDDKPVLASGRARTDPGEDGTFRFLAFGDSGWGEREQYELARLMPKYEPELVIHTGDVIYMDGEKEDYPEKFYVPYADLLPIAAFYPCIGNHDWDAVQAVPLFEVFILPRNGPEQATPERHYWFDYGGVRFVAFDSDELYDGLKDQVAPWIDEVLADAGDRWKVVYFHHPVYTASKYEVSGKILQLIVPKIDKHGVDAVFVGHNHIYERTYPIRDGEIMEDSTAGTVYITTGAGGARLYEGVSPLPDFMAAQVAGKYSFTVIDVTPERMSIRQIGMGDEILDEFTIERTGSGGATTAPATAPVTRRTESAVLMPAS